MGGGIRRGWGLDGGLSRENKVIFLNCVDGLAKFICAEDSHIESRYESMKSALCLNNSLHFLQGKSSK